MQDSKIVNLNGAGPDEFDEILAGNLKSPAEVKQGEHDQVLEHIRNISALSALIGPKALDTLKNLIFYVGRTAKGDQELLDRITLAMRADRWHQDDIDTIARVYRGAKESKFKPFSLSDLVNMPSKEWLIENVIGKGDLIMVYGAPGCGKTFVVIDLIFAACMGKTWARRFNVTRPLNVAYCAGEGLSGLAARFSAAAECHDAGDLPGFTFFPLTPQLFYQASLYGDENEAPDDIASFTAEWQARQKEGEAPPLDILIIDTLHSATAGADENSQKDMGIVLKAAKEATAALGCAVVVVHHTNKAGTAERGSSALRGAMDAMIEIKRIGDTGTKATMFCEKLKDGQEWYPQTFDLYEAGESVRVMWDEPKDGAEGEDKRKTETARTILELLVSRDGKQLTAKHIQEATDIRQQVANKVLTRLVRDGLVKRDQNERETWCYSATDEGKEALQAGNKLI